MAVDRLVETYDAMQGGSPVSTGGAISSAVRAGFVCRGVHARHPALAEALRGEVIPGDPNGAITPEQHNAGGYSAESPYTSWTHDFNVARDFALGHVLGVLFLNYQLVCLHQEQRGAGYCLQISMQSRRC
jgi:hypothetical protein